MKVSFFQFNPIFNSISENVTLIKELINKNKKIITESGLLVFPEYSFSGPINMNNLDSYKAQIEKTDIQKVFSEISGDLKDTAIVFGSLIFKQNNKFANVSMVYRNGEILGKYDKKALIYNENYICEATDNYLIFNVGNYRIGLAICWDLILPEVFRKYVGKVDLVIIPSFWGIGGNALQSKYSFSLEKKYYRELCIARAYENSLALLFVNSVGKYNSDFYSDRMMGGSLAVMPPLGETYFTNSKNPTEIHTVDLDFNYLDQYREYYATDKDYKYYKSKNIF